MPGPEDRLIKQDPSQAQPRSDPADHRRRAQAPREQDRRAAYPPTGSDAWRESPQSLSELRQSLERLRPGLPSSPYNSDGSRKPSPPDLTKCELPLPDEPGWQSKPATEGANPRSRRVDQSLDVGA